MLSTDLVVAKPGGNALCRVLKMKPSRAVLRPIRGLFLSVVSPCEPLERVSGDAALAQRLRRDRVARFRVENREDEFLWADRSRAQSFRFLPSEMREAIELPKVRPVVAHRLLKRAIRSFSVMGMRRS